MKKIYDIRGEFNRTTQGEHARLTVADRVPVGAILVNYSAFRDTSRWTHVDRKKPFEVAIKGRVGEGWQTRGWYKTLDAAVKAAEKLANE